MSDDHFEHHLLNSFEKKAAFARALNSPRQRQPFSSLARSELLDYPTAHRNKRGVRLE